MNQEKDFNVLDVLDSLTKKNTYILHVNQILDALKIGAKCKNVKINKHLAFFDLELDPGASISKLENKLREISIGIKSKTIPIMSIIPSAGIVRLQVAISDAKSVDLESLYCDYNVPSTEESLLPILLGETDHGEKLIVDFAKNPHTLIAGGTGSGKSVLLHNIIANIIYLNFFKIRDVELILIDPKQVEFAPYTSSIYNGVVKSVIDDYNSVSSTLSDLETEMNRRYNVLKELNIRSIEDYPNIFSQIVVIIDETADLMMQDKRTKTFEKSIVKLAQKSRACGIYIIMATQRPSADVITGLIKANFPARIACKTASKVDSLVILDSVGAENLMGRGDAVISTSNYGKARFQVAFSEPKKIESIIMSKAA